MASISASGYPEGPSPVPAVTRMFSLRIVHLDYYMATPLAEMDDCFSHFQGRGVREVPVVRIFGATTSGQKTCLHLHKAYPYFYVPYDQELPQDLNEALAYVRRLASAVEKALKVASTARAKRQHVHSCSFVRGRKYYGYYPSEQLFVKIVLYYPQEMSRTSTLLLSGGIMNHKFQPHEAHIPYLLQIMIDYNLYGMGHLHLSTLKFRTPLPGSLVYLTDIVKRVKSKYLRNPLDSAAEQGTENLNSAAATSFKGSEVAEMDQSPSDANMPSKKGELPPTPPPVAEAVSSGSRQSTPAKSTPGTASGSQPEFWLQGTIPEEWVWPVLSSSQGRYAKQSICELEADASVKDILNKGELLFRPLQEAAPDLKMVQSLTPMWEEELRRTGEDGPAGSVSSQYQPTARQSPSTPPLEKAMRGALYEIAKADEHQLDPTRDGQNSTAVSHQGEKRSRGTPTEDEPVQSSEEETKGISPVGIESMTPLTELNASHKEQAAVVGNLLSNTQVANGDTILTQEQAALVAEDNTTYEDEIEDDYSDDDDPALNREAIKFHLSQRLRSQELESEAVDILNWLATTQAAEDETDRDNGGEMALSQFYSSPGMDSALLKALDDYETAMEQECQAILDCAPSLTEDEEEYEQLGGDMSALREERKEAERSQVTRNVGIQPGWDDLTRISMDRGDTPTLEKDENIRKRKSAFIPQTDGAGDYEDEYDEGGLGSDGTIPAKRARVDSQSATPARAHSDDSKSRDVRLRQRGGDGADSKEVSVREMMRRRREKRPRKKELSFSQSSLSGDTTDGESLGSLKKFEASSGSQPEELRVHVGQRAGGMSEKQLPQVSVKAEPRMGLGSASRGPGNVPAKHSKREEKEKAGHHSQLKGQSTRGKYAALPFVVKAKSEAREINTYVVQELPLGNKADEVDLLGVETRNKAENFRDTNFDAINRGDGRDCGGGILEPAEGPHSQDHTKKQSASDGSSTRQLDEHAETERPEKNQLLQVNRERDDDTQGMGSKPISNKFYSETQGHLSPDIGISNRRVMSDYPKRPPADYSEAGKHTSRDANAMANPIVDNHEHIRGDAVARNVEYPVAEHLRDVRGSHLERPSIAEGDPASQMGLEDEVPQPTTQYHFTDMSDSSEEISDPELGECFDEEWVAKAALDNYMGQNIGGSHVEEGGTSDKTSYEKQTGVAPELFVSGLSAGKEDAGFESDMSSPTEPEMCAPSSSSLGRPLGRSSCHALPGDESFAQEGSRNFKTSTSMPAQESFEFSSHLSQKRPPQEEGVMNIEADIQGYEKSSTFHPPGRKAAAPLPRIGERTIDQITDERESVIQKLVETAIIPSPKVQGLVPCNDGEEGKELLPLMFHRRPPDREHILRSCKDLRPADKEEEGVFYGNVKDVPDRPTIMAGLIFDVKSRDPVHLRPFTFGGPTRRSKFDGDSKRRQYIEQEAWNAGDGMDAAVGVPSHVENDGTVLYLITPAKPPPTLQAVRQWASANLAAQPGEVAKAAHSTHGEQVFTMDANTGKLVPLVHIGSAKNSQEALASTDSSQQDPDLGRPASPKYDETHVFNLTYHSSAPSIRRSFSPREPASVKDASLSAAVTQKLSAANWKQPLAPCTSTQEMKQPVPEDPPSKQNTGKVDHTKSPVRQWRDISQMTAITPAGRSTPLSQAGFQDPASSGGGQQVTLMSIEVFAETRGDLLPDPRYDPIGCIVVVLHEDGGKSGYTDVTVVLVRDEQAHSNGRLIDGIQNCETIYLPDEMALLKCFTRLVNECDPDMLLGWEIQGYSLGLVAERAASLGIGLLKQLSRIPPVSATAEGLDKGDGLNEVGDLFDKLPREAKGGDEPIIEDEWGRTHGSGLYVGGRIVLNVWRIMRGEVKLGIYSLEAVAEAVLRRRVPRIPWRTLTRWFTLGSGGGRFRCLEYFIDRARLNLQIMDQLDLVNRTAELARVFGIDFYSVFSRGSQFRVESMMARLAHTQNYVLVSPTRQQVADQPAMECLPLVMEPESRFYTNPVVVLDFQSLYPSMIIAYNLCFSTCLGKLIPDNPKVLGATRLSVQPGLLDSLKECMTISPNGVLFVPKEVRPGVLPRLLQEILSTRIMVKKAMKKLSPDQRVLQRVLNARQFALKLIANVTYGYTAAGFSGRMPCAEIADSIVQFGRLTLERAIDLVNSHPRWGARVVYGDTDSMFVLLKGRTREEAHAIGQEIAAAVTETNPPPVALKMEKVYHPCVLLTKKRYVGYSYESPSQVKAVFDAKGIETVRRDSCLAVAKTLEYSLRTLFESRDLSQVKQYLQRQWGKILSGRVSLQDFVFAKEVRLGTYSSRSPVLPPAAIVASKAMAIDPRAEPRYAERIPYVVVHGEPGARLVDMVVDPLTLIDQPSLRLHDTYYITKQIIPACQRIFMLVGADLKAWFSEMPRVYRPPVSKRVSSLAVGTRSTKWDPEASKKKRLGLKHGTIDQYYLSRHCTICGEFTRASNLLCSNCVHKPEAAALLIPGRTSRLEKELKHILAICRHCGGGDGSLEGTVACVSLDCSVFFERRKVHRELEAAGLVAHDLGHYPLLTF